MEQTFTLKLDDSDFTVEVHGNTFIVNGHPFVVGFEDDGTVTVDGIAYDVTLDGEVTIVDGIAHQLQVGGLGVSSASTGPAPSPPSAAGAGVVQAIMPGSIVRVLAAEGDQVAVGDVLLVLEAMKMENEIGAPIPGTVKALYVQPGQTVEMNAVLVEIEPL